MSRRAFSVAVFLVNGGEVLLIKHKRLGLWLPVGGEIEDRYVHDAVDGRRKTGEVQLETPHEAARREVREETGIVDLEFPTIEDALDGEPAGLLGYEEHACGDKGTHLNFNFVAMVKTREIVSDGSFTEHRWNPIGDLLVYGSTRSVQQCIDRIHRLIYQEGWKS